MSGSLGPLTDQLVGRRDETTGAILLTGWAAGPAGLATVRVAHGAVEVSVDYAEPGTVSQVVVAPDAEGSPPVVTALDRLLAGGWHDLATGLTTEPRVVWRPAGRGLPRIGRPSVVADLGRLAILEAETVERRLSLTGAAVADVERALLAAGLPTDLHVAPNAAALLRRGGSALLDIGAGELQARLSWPVQMELADLLTRALDGGLDDGLDRSVADALADLASALRDGKPGNARPAAAASMAPPAPLTAAAAAPSPAAPAASRARFRRVTPDAMEFDRPLEMPPPGVAVEVDPALDVEVMRTTLAGGHLEVVVAASAPTELWLRLLRADRRPVLLTMGPARRNDFGSATATVLVPGDVPIDRLVADITDRPGQRFLSPTVRTTQRAVRVGRDACRAERAAAGGTSLGPTVGSAHGDIRTAVDRWELCAADWHAAGDARRAALAERYAQGLAATDAPPGATTTTTAFYRAGPAEREALEPFVTDRVERS